MRTKHITSNSKNYFSEKSGHELQNLKTVDLDSRYQDLINKKDIWRPPKSAEPGTNRVKIHEEATKVPKMPNMIQFKISAVAKSKKKDVFEQHRKNEDLIAIEQNR